MNQTNPNLDNLGSLDESASPDGAPDFGNFADLPEGLGIDPQEMELNKAIEELRGVLRDEETVDTTKQSVTPSSPNASLIMNIPVDVQIVLGSAEMTVSDLMELQKGSTVALNRRIGEPVDVVVNGRKIACGEITVLENDPSRFGIKLTRIIGAANPG